MARPTDRRTRITPPRLPETSSPGRSPKRVGGSSQASIGDLAGEQVAIAGSSEREGHAELCECVGDSAGGDLGDDSLDRHPFDAGGLVRVGRLADVLCGRRGEDMERLADESDGRVVCTQVSRRTEYARIRSLRSIRVGLRPRVPRPAPRRRRGSPIPTCPARSGAARSSARLGRATARPGPQRPDRARPHGRCGIRRAARHRRFAVTSTNSSRPLRWSNG